jgi:hypothetical protein
MNPVEKAEEIAKVRSYIEQVEAEIAKVGIYPRRPSFNKFDVIALSLVSKAFSLAKACIHLLEAGFDDEAYGLCRASVECAWILRFLTQDPTQIEKRVWKYINFLMVDKQFWMYHARITAKDEETKAEIREHARELDLHDDPTEVESHWSGNKGFAWKINQGDHPLDGPGTNQLSKSSEYAVHYHQTSSFLHCFEPVVENFLPDERTPFKVKLADGNGGQPSQLVLYILATYLHATIGYTFFGLGLDRPSRFNELYSELVNDKMRPVPRRVNRPERKETPLEDLPELRPWLTWSELTGADRDAPGKRKQLAELILKYPRHNILRACAALSVLFNFGPDGNTAAEDALTLEWIPRLFAPDLVEKVKAYASSKRVIFFQAQLRFLASETIRLVPDTAPTAPVLPNEVIGEMLLRSGEMLYKKYERQADSLDELANKAAIFLPYYEIDSQHDPAFFFLRSYIYLTVIIPSLPANLQTFDIRKMFQEQFGFSLTEYCEFIFMFFMHAMTVRNNKSVETAIESGMHVGTFRNTTVPPEAIERMFKKTSLTLDELKALKPEIGFADFDFLRNQPYYRHEDQVFCLDYEFAVNKIESAVIWTMLRNFKTDGEKDAYLGYWGHVFERYVAWLLQTYAIPAFNTIHVAPSYVDDPSKEICDVIVKCGTTAVLIEAKLATCPSKTRYSGNFQKMRDFLELKLVDGVGVEQLANAVVNITTDPEKTNDSIPEIPAWLSNVKTIMPVIVTRDDIGSSWAVNGYLNNRFEQNLLGRKRHKKISVAPLLSLSVGTLEKLMDILSKMSLDTVLEQRIKKNPTLTWPFDAASKYVHRGMPRNTPKHMEILHEIEALTIKDFGVTDPPPQP